MDLSQLADIALKLIVGMLGILAFLRIVGKGQMGQITPLDTVSAFVIGALVGGVAYNPDMTILHLIFACSCVSVCALHCCVAGSRARAIIS